MLICRQVIAEFEHFYNFNWIIQQLKEQKRGHLPVCCDLECLVIKSLYFSCKWPFPHHFEYSKYLESSIVMTTACSQLPPQPQFHFYCPKNTEPPSSQFMAVLVFLHLRSLWSMNLLHEGLQMSRGCYSPPYMDKNGERMNDQTAGHWYLPKFVLVA